MPTTIFKNTVYRMLLPVCAPGCSRHPVTSVHGHALTHFQSFEKLVYRHHVLGSATLLVSDNVSSLIFTSSVRPPHEADPGTFFRVASITKTATAILAMRLSEMGILNPDEPVGNCFNSPLIRSVTEGITLRHLLSHTSGIVDPPLLESSLESGTPFTELLPAARCFPPGRSFHYSNFGYGLIGCVFEAVLSIPLGEIFRDYLFSPLKMNATLEGCYLPMGSIMPVTRIFPWRKEKDMIITELGSRPLLHPDPLYHYGHTAGSMYIDIDSLYKLLGVLIGNGSGYLSPETLIDMKQMHASYGSLSPTLSYGLGLLRINDSYFSDHCVYGHQGFAYGCADGAFWDDITGYAFITLNGGCSEARVGRLGLANRDFLHWSFRKELPTW